MVSWCVGHLVELAPADAYDPRYSKWAYDDLPIVPDPWQFQVLPDTKKQFHILRQLLDRDDVETVVCATDAGREGELIFRLTYHLCGCTKPVKRLWISSMEESAIRRGFDNLIDGKQYDNLYAAALCRAKADWLIGINGTRLFTCVYRGKTLNVGRVMTPTLTLLAEREAAIGSFKKEKFLHSGAGSAARFAPSAVNLIPRRTQKRCGPPAWAGPPLCGPWNGRRTPSALQSSMI